MNGLITITILLVTSASIARADCSAQDVTVVGAVSDKIGIYDANGKFQSEISKDQLVPGGAVQDCDESFGLVKVTLVSGAEEWLDRAELKLAVGGRTEARTICVEATNSRPVDHKVAAVSGLGSKAPLDCVATEPAASAKP